MRRLSPSWWVRLKSGWKVGVAALVTSIGIASAYITAVSGMGEKMPGWQVAALLCACVLTAITAAYVKGRITLIPDSLVDELSADGLYTCQPCSEVHLREACDMTKPFYGHEYVEARIALEWWRKSPNSFIELLNSEGLLCACFAILPLENSFMEQFLKGRVEDRQIDGSDLCDDLGGKRCTRLYISGVIVRDHCTFIGRKRANVMIWAMLQYLKVRYGFRRDRTLYAVSVTKESEKLMTNLGFSVLSDGRDRRDKCKLFCYPLNKASWQKLYATVGDWSKTCTCRFV